MVKEACLMISNLIQSQKNIKANEHSPDPSQICVADLLWTPFVNVKEKLWRWYLSRRVAVCSEPYASLPGIEFSLRLLRQDPRTKAITVL